MGKKYTYLTNKQFCLRITIAFIPLGFISVDGERCDAHPQSKREVGRPLSQHSRRAQMS